MIKKKIIVAVVVNNRANYARIKSFLLCANKSKKIKINLILAGSALIEKFGNLENIIKNDGLKVSNKLYTIIEGDKPVIMAKSTAVEISELANIFENNKPDYVLAIADRFETLSVAIAASYMNIPLIHLQGGEITGSIDESVRHAISKLSNIHFPATNKSRKNLVKMGEKSKTIFNVGCPSIDIAKSIEHKKKNVYQILKKYKFSMEGISDLKTINKYVIIAQHPVTTEYNKTKYQIKQTIKSVSKLNLDSIWLWPNVDSGSDIISKELRKAREKKLLRRTIFLKNIEVDDFLILLNQSNCIVGNSSVGIREASYLGTPAVNIGNRQNGREKAKNVINCEHNYHKIMKSVNYQIKKKKYKKSFLYGDGTSGKKITNIILKLKVNNTQKKLSYGL